MSPDNYKYLADLLEKKVGLVLGENKSYLLTARLTPLLEKYGASDLDDLMAKLKAANAKLLPDIIDAMTTNETSFFRDGKPFELLFKNVLPKMVERRTTQRKIRIWNAACSSGQEPYSIVMGIREQVPSLASWTIEIVATDVNQQILDQAKSGLYNHFEVQRGLPVTYLVKYFEQKDNVFALKPEIRNCVQFRSLNLLDPFSAMGTFDVIFCRNVLIYFDPKVKKEILERMAKCLAPDGYLFLGGTETILGITEELQRVRGKEGTAYCRPDAPAVTLEIA